MSKEKIPVSYQGPRRIASASSKRVCFGRASVQSTDNPILTQASGLPLAPKIYQAVSQSNEFSHGGFSNFTYTISPVPACACQYCQDISTLETDPSDSALQNDTDQSRKSKKARYSSYSGNTLYGTADTMLYYYDDLFPILQDNYTPCPLSEDIERSSRQMNTHIHFSLSDEIRRRETTFNSGMIYFPPGQDLDPVKTPSLYIQDREFNFLSETKPGPSKAHGPSTRPTARHLLSPESISTEKSG
ncbi:hypothetical protein V8C42DRAFT_338443 [Trichoderma barbatum]